ncbi:hypothetical protein PVAP13_4KG209100 [Panicum virgatum]|uniref:Uncharacterized protein n=1 Tax=Panicum virgatum TaxID=38727 RepID=A0A8T0TN83_PANVG|nr:hypothetical protein PVAP13_4KG209100 [Panicum virgatum]
MRRRLQLRLKPDGRRLRLEASCGRAGEGEEMSRGEGEAVWCSADDKSTVQMREQAPADDGKLKRCGRSSTMALPMLWTPSGLSLLRILLPRLPFARCPRSLAVGRGPWWRVVYETRSLSPCSSSTCAASASLCCRGGEAAVAPTAIERRLSLECSGHNQ